MKEQVILYRLLQVILYNNGSCPDKNTQKTSWSILFFSVLRFCAAPAGLFGCI